MVKHIAVSITSSIKFETVQDLSKIMVDKKIPILSINLLSYEKIHDDEVIDQIENIFSNIDPDFINENQIKISFLGKWYSLPEKLVGKMKCWIDLTKDYDKFFLNFCVNYDGQLEIVDACKIISMQVALGKISEEAIDEGVVKDNIYNSYFLPPDFIIYTEEIKPSLFLWDSAHSKIFYCTGDIIEEVRNLLGTPA